MFQLEQSTHLYVNDLIEFTCIFFQKYIRVKTHILGIMIAYYQHPLIYTRLLNTNNQIARFKAKKQPIC